ncbi:hypothetical protein D9758_018083 [Tetrapyrgos nigripes]|uniref:Uncharacterized protein n=1 Tax=Tetrapyrgos nigripes TaxID=182062 RepID=A0A8H5BC67_9AGAR|nr:hypothetical protein D9758_018083 [Tetrapyrgos nigripes]
MEALLPTSSSRPQGTLIIPQCSSPKPIPYPPPLAPSPPQPLSYDSGTTISPRPVPPHWQIDREDNFLILRILFRIFCAIGHGQDRIEKVWDIVTNEIDFSDHRDRLASRYSSLAIMGALLITTTVSFLTTEPPRPDIFNYKERTPYLFTGGAIYATFIGTIIASAISWGLSKCSSWWYCEVMMATELRVFITIFLMAVPFLLFGLATLMEGIGAMIAAVNSGDILAIIGSVLMGSFMVVLSLLVAWIHQPYLVNAVQEMKNESNLKSTSNVDSSHERPPAKHENSTPSTTRT